MQEFKVDKKGLLLLQQNLAARMINLKQLINEIEEKNQTLLIALGENDYKIVQKKVNDMKLAYECSEQSMGKLLDSVEEYTQRVGEIRLLLRGDGTMTRVD